MRDGEISNLLAGRDAALADLAAATAETERVWRYFETDAAALRAERDEARAELAGMTEDRDEWRRYAREVEAERDEARARIAAVEALCERPSVAHFGTPLVELHDLRVALAFGAGT